MLRKWLVRMAIAIFLMELLTPVLGLMIFSVDNEGLWNLQSYARLFADGSFQQVLVNSISISLLSVALSVLLLTPPIWYGFLYSPRMLRMMEGFSFVSFVLPAVVLGLAYVQFFSNPPLALAGTPTLLPFAFTLLGMPYYIQAVLNRLRHVDAKTFHDAARSLGSSSLASWWRVQFPLIVPGIINGAVLVFSIGMGEFTITQLTTGGSYMTLPIYMQVGFQNDPLSGSAMAVVSLAIAVLCVFFALGTLAIKRRG